ncbi:MAG: DUF3341 domain-containing protein [Bacteroidales bacterium]|nr:DUF3341 domain-containing protein [Bacteroidales bacterium]
MTNKKIFGVFDDEDNLVSTIRTIRDKGIKISDVVSPYPIHEVFDELKLKTKIPVAAFFYGIFGLLATFGFLYWTSVINYPLVFGGKPQNTLSFVIVIFIMVINITIVLTIVTFFLREKKGPGAKPSIEYPGITDDKYLIVIDVVSDTDVNSVNELLKSGGAIEVTEQ